MILWSFPLEKSARIRHVSAVNLLSRRRFLSLGTVLVLFLLACRIPAEDVADDVASGPTAAQLKRVAGFIASSEHSQRRAAYRACRARGEDFKEDYFTLLTQAEAVHAKRLESMVLSRTGPKSPLGDAITKWKEWESLAPPALEFVLTDHNKDKTKSDEMDRMFDAAAKAWNGVLAIHKRNSRSIDETKLAIEIGLTALREIHKEKAWCRPDDFFEDEETDLEFFISELSLHEGISKPLATMAEMNEAIDRLAQAHAANEAQSWAGPVAKEFARLLNDRRAVLGLQPLLLDEKLSDACSEHSREMTAMSYFSHTSPVEENKTFDMRANKAGFEGSAGGECIFSGNASAVAAERAWWYSDGHRLINYSRGPNTLGIGPVGAMWTLNVGSKNH